MAPGAGPGGGLRCTNGYVNSETDDTYYFVKRGCMLGNAKDINSAGCLLDAKTNNDAYDVKISQYDRNTSAQICDSVNTSADDMPFASVPWTDVKARCNSLSLGNAFNSKV